MSAVYKLLVLTLCLFIIYQYNLTQQLKQKMDEEKQRYILEIRQNLSSKFSIELYKHIGLAYKTDKVTVHDYQNVYGTILGPLRYNSMHILEIGLGCGMPYGTGKSIPVWKEYVPNAKITFMEYNEKCALEFKSQVDNMFVGDQSDLKLMDKLGKEMGPFDFIVDDGGHTRKQQVHSLISLWPYLTSTGTYVIEDMYYSFVKSYDDNNQSSFELVVELFYLMNNPSAFDSPYKYPSDQISQHAKEISKSLLSINCYSRVCALIKK